MASACLTPRAPPTATTVFIYDAYTLRRTVVRALGHTAARKYDRYFAIAENPILINALLRKNAALDPDYATGFLQRELREHHHRRIPASAHLGGLVITRTKETKARLPTNLYDSRPA